MGDGELFDLLEPVVASQGVDLVEVRWTSSRSRGCLRVVIHSEAGVSHGDCARVTTAVDRAVDEAGLVSGNYVVEVTSPGLDRVLKGEREFEIFRGRRVRVWTDGERPEQEGISLGQSPEGEVRLRRDDGEVLTLPWPEVKKARLVPETRGGRS